MWIAEHWGRRSAVRRCICRSLGWHHICDEITRDGFDTDGDDCGNAGWSILGSDSRPAEGAFRFTRSDQHDYAQFYRNRISQLSDAELLQNTRRSDYANRADCRTCSHCAILDAAFTDWY